MKFWLWASLAQMTRAEIVTAQLFGMSHQPTQDHRSCHQVDPQAIAAADVAILLVNGETSAEMAAEALRNALVREVPVVLWRWDGGDRIHLELATHRLVMQGAGDLAEPTMQQLLAVTAAGAVEDRAAGNFERQRYGAGHGPAIAESITRGGGS